MTPTTPQQVPGLVFTSPVGSSLHLFSQSQQQYYSWRGLSGFILMETCMPPSLKPRILVASNNINITGPSLRVGLTLDGVGSRVQVPHRL